MPRTSAQVRLIREAVSHTHQVLWAAERRQRELTDYIAVFETIKASLLSLMDTVEPLVSLQEICDLQNITIEIAVKRPYHIPNYGVPDAGEKWRRETTIRWIGAIAYHEHHFYSLSGRERNRLRQELVARLAGRTLGG